MRRPHLRSRRSPIRLPARAVRAFTLSAALLAAGCANPIDLAQPEGPQNTCSSTEDCGPGASCVNDVCYATDVDLVGLLVEVRPHANAAFGATTSFLFDPAEARIPLRVQGAPLISRMDPELPLPVAVRGGRVIVHEKTQLEPGCPVAADRVVPAHLTFYRTAPFYGLNFDPIPVTTDDAYLFDVDLVRGTYDVYIEPEAVPGCNGDLPFPPVYRTGLAVLQDATSLLVDLPLVGTLTGNIADAGTPDFAGWTLDLVEPTRGLPISANAALTPTMTGGMTIQAQIAWPDQGVPILRFSPPAETVQPTVYWDLSVIEGDKTHPIANVVATQLIQKPVEIRGTIFGSDGFTRVRASLSIQSRKLDGPTAENAAFSVTNVDTDENGAFSQLLPPGDYDFRAFPAVDNGIAITDINRKINASADCFCAQSFLLSPKHTLAGSVTTVAGEKLSAATVSISPSQEKPDAHAYWTSTHALPPPTAREATGATDQHGALSLLVDPGRSDLVIQPLPGSGFPWLVLPRLDLFDDSSFPGLVVTYPAIIHGIVRDPSGAPVPYAEVNAWFPVADSSRKGGSTGTAIKIASTSTDESGAFRLVLPSSL